MTGERRNDPLDRSDETMTSGTWDREEMEIDDEGAGIDRGGPRDAEPGTTRIEEGDEAADWNIGSMEIYDGGEPQRRVPRETMGDSEEGPTGGHSNPGGGERFGDFDD